VTVTELHAIGAFVALATMLPAGRSRPFLVREQHIDLSS
jgi:hypothetical protein